MNNAEKNIEPEFFVVLKHRLLQSPTLPKHLGDLYVVEFANKDLEDPKSDPIALYYTGGTRKFLWRDTVYGEYNVNASDLLKDAKLDNGLSDMLRRYSRNPFPFVKTFQHQQSVSFAGIKGLVGAWCPSMGVTGGINHGKAPETETIVRVLYKLRNQGI